MYARDRQKPRPEKKLARRGDALAQLLASRWGTKEQSSIRNLLVKEALMQRATSQPPATKRTHPKVVRWETVQAKRGAVERVSGEEEDSRSQLGGSNYRSRMDRG
jgi:hypothetical protein